LRRWLLPSRLKALKKPSADHTTLHARCSVLHRYNAGRKPGGFSAATVKKRAAGQGELLYLAAAL